ncbi:hypothetical protein AMK21_13570 [Streptomyces sp. CB00316]|uniref:hypothetical protein n=1 Tax=Streptomyces sp. CB00316 TaxID=1703932 RepID=UPI00093B74A3|nr:hypothetical protein [Streptomyces sp. CB00316]OKJ20950.1 hypothetical protein AMK21_13570 [Streptomyces sp. CB00316]
MSTLGPRSRTRLVAVGYVGLVTLAALAYEIAGQPEAGQAAMTLAAWPGDIVLLVMIYPLALLPGDDPLLGETGFSLLAPLLHGAGALVNVLIVWGVIAFARHFKAEYSRSR